MELRCPARRKLFAIIEPDEDTIEVRCRDKQCGFAPGIVVIHKFNLKTGKLINTQRFTDPNRRRK